MNQETFAWEIQQVANPALICNEISEDRKGCERWVWKTTGNLRPPIGERTLWIFNDNLQDRDSNILGEGNAVIRPYNRYGKWRDEPYSVGISTGNSEEGFGGLTPTVRLEIKKDLRNLENLLKTGHYNIVKFSSDKDGYLDADIFNVNSYVKHYIVKNIYHIIDALNNDTKIDFNRSIMPAYIIKPIIKTIQQYEKLEERRGEEEEEKSDIILTDPKVKIADAEERISDRRIAEQVEIEIIEKKIVE